MCCILLLAVRIHTLFTNPLWLLWAKEDAGKAMEAIKAAGETPYIIGEVKAGEKGVELC